MEEYPPRVKALFQPRPALRYLPPLDHAPEFRQTTPISAHGPYMAILRAAQAEQKAQIEAELAAGKEVVNTDPYAKKMAEKKEMDEYNKHQVAAAREQRLSKDDPGKLKNLEATLHLRRLHPTTTEADVRNHFRGCGTIDEVRVIKHDLVKSAAHRKKYDGIKAPKLPRKIRKNLDRQDRKYKNLACTGKGFISFKRVSDSHEAQNKMNNTMLKGRLIGVDVARGTGMDQEFTSRKEGGGLGGRGSSKMSGQPSGATGQSGPSGMFRARGDFSRGGGGFRGGRSGGWGGRGGIGYRDAPDGAPAGPRGGGRSGYGGGGRENGYGGGRYDERSRDFDRGASGTNMEPLGRRDRGFGGGGDRDGGYRRDERYRDRDREADPHARRRYDDRERPSREYDRGGRDEDRKRRRYDDEDARDSDPRRRRM